MSALLLVFILQLGSGLVVTQNCESMTSCDLYTELQEHSKLIAGFSYNVKKADAALTQLRAEQNNVMSRVAALEADLGVDNGTEMRSNQETIALLNQQDRALQAGVDNIAVELKALKEEVSSTFFDNIRRNDDDLEDTKRVVSALTEQVKRLDEVVRNHTEGMGLLPPAATDAAQQQLVALKAKQKRLEARVGDLTQSCGDTGGSNLDSLGIELETVKSSFETLQDQVTELQDKCVNQNQRLQAMLEDLTMRVDELEAWGTENESAVFRNTVRSKLRGDRVVRVSSSP